MRHGKKFNHLGRQKGHRKAMLSNMAVSLITHKKINTTVAKAKALRKFVEPLVTKAKTDSMHSRRTVFSYLQSKDALKELFGDIATKVANREGGYTRILKTGTRLGDGAEMCFIEFVDYNENMLNSGDTKKKSRRSRRGGKKTTSEATSTSKATEAKVDEVPIVEDAKVEEVVDAPKDDKKAEAPKKTEEKLDVPKETEVKSEEKAEKPKAKKAAPKAEKKDDSSKDDSKEDKK